MGRDTISLTQVSLGMPLSEVRRVRPAARFKGHVGLAEALGADTIRYVFTKTRDPGLFGSLTLEPEEYADDAPLIAVVISREHAADSAAMSWVSGAVARLRRYGTPQCRYFVTGGYRTYEVFVPAPIGFVGAHVQLSFPPHGFHATTQALHTSQLDVVFPFRGERLQRDCSTLASTVEPLELR